MVSKLSRPAVVAVVVVILVAVGLWVLVFRPFPEVPASAAQTSAQTSAQAATTHTSAPTSGADPPAATGPSSQAGSKTTSPPPTQRPGQGSTPARAPIATPTPRPTTTPAPKVVASECVAGEPSRLVMPALGVDAPFETIGLDTTAAPDARGLQPLGNPRDRTRAGWYRAGPAPGSGQGTILTNGHTYRDGSAIFKEDFASRVQVGQVISIVQRNGSVCSYRITQLWPEVNANRDYPRLIANEKIYNFQGPERLFLTTCGGNWNSRAQDYDEITLLIATPIGRS